MKRPDAARQGDSRGGPLLPMLHSMCAPLWPIAVDAESLSGYSQTEKELDE